MAHQRPAALTSGSLYGPRGGGIGGETSWVHAGESDGKLGSTLEEGHALGTALLCFRLALLNYLMHNLVSIFKKMRGCLLC